MATVESEITADMLTKRRGHFIKVKGAIVGGLTRCFSSSPKGLLAQLQLLWEVWHIIRSVLKYPEPTLENTKEQTARVLLEIFDEFFKYDSNIYYSPKRPGREPLYRAIKRILVCECEHDVDYTERITWFLKQLSDKYIAGEWPVLEPWMPTNCWRDPVTLAARRKKRIELITETLR